MIFLVSMTIIFGLLVLGMTVARNIRQANYVIKGAEYIEGGVLYEENHEYWRDR